MYKYYNNEYLILNKPFFDESLCIDFASLQKYVYYFLVKFIFYTYFKKYDNIVKIYKYKLHNLYICSTRIY